MAGHKGSDPFYRSCVGYVHLHTCIKIVTLLALDSLRLLGCREGEYIRRDILLPAAVGVSLLSKTHSLFV